MTRKGDNGPGTFRSWFRRHEGTLSLVWLGGVAVFLLLLAFAPTRERALAVVQRVILWREGRWDVAIDKGEAMLRAGRYDEAVAYLTELDQRFPARTVKHGRDKDRERVLLLLAQGLAALDKKSRSMAVYQQLVAFDPNNFRNWYAMGVGADKLLSGWALAQEARDAYAAALVINPSHLPSLRGVIRFDSEQGLYDELRTQYETYLDAFLAADVTFLTADSAITITMPVDGNFHEVELPLGQP
ncbi:MAG: tetratricopeptide repeat protein, partial [Gemmatimonadales bacterium]